MGLHDSHFHLDLYQSPEKLANEIERNRIYTIAVTNSPSVFFYTEKICSDKKYIRPALGLHPELAFERYSELKQFEALVSRTRYIGEIGLDNFKKSEENFAYQKKAFERIVNICADYGDKIVTIHSRNASTQVLEILTAKFPGKVIMHWFTDSLKNLEIALERGYYFSVNNNMLHSKNGTRIIDRIPTEKILIETDGPFTTIDSKPSTPLQVPIILDRLQKIKNPVLNAELDTKQQVLQNFKSLITS